MRVRIVVWAGVGALVTVLWNLYISATPNLFAGTWALVYLTCPIALARNDALSFYSVLVANAVTYAVVGTVVETMRRHHERIKLTHL